MNINFTQKELEVIQLMEPKMTPEQIINTVLRSWFNANSERMYNTVKTPEQKLDEIIIVSKGKGRDVVK
ncbi:MAG: hypothetical protein DDT19_02286 [Syntrophomonadaceae bacterium]|nr:hypothetical protein [Bacillota bacterium]